MHSAAKPSLSKAVGLCVGRPQTNPAVPQRAWQREGKKEHTNTYPGKSGFLFLALKTLGILRVVKQSIPSTTHRISEITSLAVGGRAIESPRLTQVEESREQLGYWANVAINWHMGHLKWGEGADHSKLEAGDSLSELEPAHP